MSCKKSYSLYARRMRFIKRLLRSITLAFLFILISLFLGMLGYHSFEHMKWLDVYVNAAMILSGMDPVNLPQTDIGKLFEGTYFVGLSSLSV